MDIQHTTYKQAMGILYRRTLSKAYTWNYTGSTWTKYFDPQWRNVAIPQIKHSMIDPYNDYYKGQSYCAWSEVLPFVPSI